MCVRETPLARAAGKHTRTKLHSSERWALVLPCKAPLTWVEGVWVEGTCSCTRSFTHISVFYSHEWRARMHAACTNGAVRMCVPATQSPPQPLQQAQPPRHKGWDHCSKQNMAVGKLRIHKVLIFQCAWKGSLSELQVFCNLCNLLDQ